MFNVVASVDGVEVVNRAFSRTEGFVADMRNFAPGISAEFYKAEGEQFESQGAKGASGKWAALSKAYERFKTVRFPGKGILEATGALRESLTDPEALDAIFLPSKDEIIFGTKVPYALAHHRVGKLPKRPVIDLSESQKRRITKAIQRGLVDFTRQAGFHVEEKAA